MTATLVVHNDPFRPSLNVETSEVSCGITICETLINSGFCTPLEHSIQRNSPFIVMLNGQVVLQNDWNFVLSSDDVLQVTRLPRGGGGGGSNVGNILGAIVIAVAAYFTFGISVVATAAIGAAAYVGLSLLTGPTALPTSGNKNSGESTSPTYTLSAQGNAARLLQAIPRVYGEMYTYPDLAAQPYSEYEGNQQFLYQLFCVSLGDVDIVRMEFDGSLIENFPDAQYQIIKPNQAVTLFPDNVIVSEAVTGQTMLAPNNVNYATVGPFNAVPAGQKANFLAVDFSNPSGVGKINDSGVTVSHTVNVIAQYRLIDDAGKPIGNWTTFVDAKLTFATTQAQITSFKVAVEPGRYQVQALRVTNETLDNRTYDTTQWISLRAYLTSTFTYGNVTLIAVKARATNLLNNSTARKFGVLSRGLIPVWDPVNGWSAPKFSANPVWVASDILRNQDYGRRLPTSRLNIQKFYTLSQTAQNRGDEFNGVFDTTSQLWDSLTNVCRVMRAVPMYYAGVIDIIRDEPATLVTAKFSPSNMIADSFEAGYQFFEVNTPDHVVVRYTDRETWTVKEVSCILPGEPSVNPATVDMTLGVTNRDQAFREGISIAAGNRDRRRTIQFSTLTPGLVLKYNGLIRVSHDVPQWGFSGRILSFDQATGRVRSSEIIPITANVVNVIGIRKKDGSEMGPYTIVADPTANDSEGVFGAIIQATAEIRAAIAAQVSDGVREDFTFYSCGPTERFGIKALVMSAKPDSNGKTTVSCINYADSVHSAENGGIVPAPGPESSLPGIAGAPVVDSVTVAYTTTVGQQNIIATPARGAIYYEFNAKKDGDSQWSVLANQEMPTLSVNLSPGNWSVRVRAINRDVGPWATWTGPIEATSLPTANLDTFTAKGVLFGIDLAWSWEAKSVSIAKAVEIYMSLNNNLGDATKLTTLPYPANSYKLANLLAGDRRFFWARVIDTAGRVGNWFNNGVQINAVASTEALPILNQIAGQVTKSELGKELLSEIALITAPSEVVGSVNARINETKALLDKDIGNLQKAVTDTNTIVNQVKSDVATINGKIEAIGTVGLYDKTKTYAVNATSRTADGMLYTAIKAVPVNTPPPNTEYWLNVGQVAITENGSAARINLLTTRVTNAEGSITSQASLINGLRTDVNGKASQTSFDSLSSTVNTQGQTITSQGQKLTSLESSINDKASASSVTALTNRVTATESAITSQGSRVTSLENSVNSTSNGLATKASASSVDALTNRVSAAEGTLTSQSSRVTNLENSVNSASTGLATKATAASVTALTNRVTATESSITSQGSNIVSLTNNLSNAGGENLAYNPDFNKAAGAANDLPDGYLADGPGSPGASTGVFALVPSFMNSAEKAQRITVTGINESALYRSIRNAQNRLPKIIAGQPICDSVYVKGTAGLGFRMFIQQVNAAGATLTTTNTVMYYLTGDVQRIALAVPSPVADAVAIAAFYRVYGSATVTGGYIDIARPQVEYGTIPTGWSNNGQINSADILATSAAVTSLTSKVEQQGTAITSASQNITDLSNTVSGIQRGMGASGLDPAPGALWNFDEGIENWTASSATLSNVKGALRMTSTGTDPFIMSPLLSITGYLYPIIRLKVTRVAGSGWDGRLFTRTASHGWGAWFKDQPNPNLAIGASAILEYDLSSLTTGGSDWVDNVALGVRIDLGNTTADVFDVDWIAIGRVGPSASSKALDALTSSVTAQGTTITAISGRTTALESTVNSTVNGLATKASASAVNDLGTRVSSAEGVLTTQSNDITVLKSAVGSAGSFVSGAAFEFLNSNQGWAPQTSGATMTPGPLFSTVAKYTTLQRNGMTINGSENPFVRFRFKRKGTSRTQGSMYWANQDGGLAEARRANFEIKANTEDWQDVEIDLSANTGWYGKTINAVRLDFMNTSDASAILDIAYFAAGRRSAAASAQAVSGLTTTVTQQGSTIDAQGKTITDQGSKITAQAQQFSSLNAYVGDIATTLNNETSARANSDQALGQRIDTVQASVGNLSASVQQTSSVLATTNGSLNAQYSVKVMLRSNGQAVVAGYGLGLSNTEGVTQSQFIVSADRFVVLNANLGDGGVVSSPFAIVNGQVFINDAFIQKATIQNALIGATISSLTLSNFGEPIMRTDYANGQIIIVNKTTQGAYMIIRQDGIFMVQNGVTIVELSIG